MTRHRQLELRAALLVSAALSVALVASACGGAIATSGRPSIETLRSRAADHPNDPDAQRELAFAEMLMQGGDPARVEAQLARALALATDDERLMLLNALHAELHGQPSVALTRYLDALDAAHTSERADAQFVAEVAAKGVEDLAEVTPRFVEIATPRLEAVLDTPGRAGSAARFIVGRTLTDLAFRRGDAEAVRALGDRLGCIPELRAAGPFGPRELLGFDIAFPPEEGDGQLAASYDLGVGRGVRPTRELEARGCGVHLGGGPVAEGGTTYAQATVEAATEAHYVVRVETPNPVQLFVDGSSVARLDFRVEPLVRVTFHRVHLTAGPHQIRVKVTTRHPNPVLSVAITDDAGRAASLSAGRGVSGAAFDAGRPAADSAFGAFIAGSVAMARGDVVGAREALREETPPRGASPVMLQLSAVVALLDPLVPPDVRRDEARRSLRAARRRDAHAWFPIVELAKLEAADGRIAQAITALERAESTWPDVVGIPLSRADLLLARGWDAQADRAVEIATRAAPDVCAVIRGALAASERRLRYPEMMGLADRLVACDARQTVRFQLMLRRRDFDGAAEELARLARLEPRQSRLGLLSSEMEIARGRADTAAIDRVLTQMAEESPRSILTPIQRADRALAQGDVAGARTILTTAIDAEPAALAELRLLSRAIGGEFALAPYRKDGAEVLRSFEASGRTYDQPEVLLFDYTVVRVFDDGSALELTHNIWRIQSDESIDERGEWSPPPGARVLTLHTVKADGRRIEPDAIAGKDTISLPNLAIGDYVEYEYVAMREPPNGFPGGYLGDRFYFRSYETPFDTSQLTLVMPESMEPNVDPRGPAPVLDQHTEDGLRVMRWTARESRPLVPEPMSVAPREFIPSINVGVGATWSSFVESLVDALVDQDVRDPEAERLVLRILGEARRGNARDRARLLYQWVLANIENTNEVFGSSPTMLRDRTGNRARILHYLLRLARVRSKLVIARPLDADQTESDLADGETYQHLLVMLGNGADAENATLLSTVERGAPFGYVPQALRDQPALVLDESARRITVHGAPEGSDRRVIEVDVELAQNGSAKVDVVETFRGATAVAWRNDLEGIPAAVLEERFEEAYVTRLVPGATLETLRITGREEAEQPLVFHYRFEVSELGRRQGGRRIVPGIFPSLLAPVYARLGERTTPQVVAPAVDADIVVRFRVASGMELPTAPRPVELRVDGGGHFVMRTHRDDGALVIERSLRLPIMRVAPEAYPALATFCRSVDEAEVRELSVRVR